MCGLVTLPWPPRELFPNSARRRHWGRNAKDARGYRNTCWALATAARLRVGAGEVPVLMTITFNPPDRRRRDDDGMISAFKAGRDGIADALGVDDHTFRPTYVIGEPVKGGAVVVAIA